MIKNIELIIEKDIPVEHILSDRFIKGRGKWEDGTEFYAVKEKVVDKMDYINYKDDSAWQSSSAK
jgi:hypothetical protein